ncbi:zinc ribbon domain-containing protein [Nocardioides sp.]|uniref:FmdB family zinc ribbon protein n=1 Tax=Nocardioides sp. TaxID=35761 RepID=UPI002D1FAA9A|nr:zinc ribbon domain-containing protein [Nocardioides sp.]
MGTLVRVPRYEFRCRSCGSTFIEQRPMSASADPATCPQGHDDTVRLLSTVAVARGGTETASSAGGCCGGSCGCG